MLICAFLILSHLPGFSQSEKSNSEVVNKLLSDAFIPIVNFSFEGSNSVSIDVEDNVYRKIAEMNLIQLCAKKKLYTTIGNHFEKYLINATVNAIETAYPKTISYPLFGDKKLEREIRVRGSYFLKKDSVIVTLEEFDRSAKDTISSSQLDRIESTEYFFLRAELPAENFFRALIEPSLIAAISAAVIYLFFSVRSK
jgi:hypothetical protein